MRCICGHILPPKWIHCQPEASVTKALPVTGLPCQSSMEAQNKSVFASEEILKIRSAQKSSAMDPNKCLPIFIDNLFEHAFYKVKPKRRMCVLKMTRWVFHL